MYMKTVVEYFQGNASQLFIKCRSIGSQMGD